MVRTVRSGRWQLDLGARPIDSSTVHFRVWAPHAKQVSINFIGQFETAIRPPVQMNPSEHGYFDVTVSGTEPGARYRYVLDGQKERPDPASRFQPDGVHGPSEVIDPDAFQWSDDDWAGLAFQQLVIYELHVGTFTRGTEHFKPLFRSSSIYGTKLESRQSNSCLLPSFPVDGIGGMTGHIPLQSKPAMVDLRALKPLSMHAI